MSTNSDDVRSAVSDRNHETPSIADDTAQVLKVSDTLAQQTKSTRTNVDYNPKGPQPTAVYIHLPSTLHDMHLVMKEYIALKVHRLTKKTRFGGNLCSEISKLLQSRSLHNNLLWINMVCDIVETQGLPWNAPDIIKGLATGVSDLYSQRIRDLSCRGQDEHYCNEIFSIAMIAFRPFSLVELQSLVNFSEVVDIIIIIERRCFSFLEIIDNIVYFKHSTAAQEYLWRFLNSYFCKGSRRIIAFQ